MARRLDEMFTPGDRCEVYFADSEDPRWLPAVVLGFQRPGCWVQANNGSVWFVTNTRRIRPLATDAHSDNASY